MGLLDKLFGRGGGSSTMTVESAVDEIAVIYGDPEVKSEGGLSILGRQANEVREIGKNLHKAGGREAMVAARDAVRDKYPWAGSNLEAIWSSLPEWNG